MTRKPVYGKRVKSANTFATSDFFSGLSRGEAAINEKIDYLATGIENVTIGDKSKKKAPEKSVKKAPLRTKDTNCTRLPEINSQEQEDITSECKLVRQPSIPRTRRKAQQQSQTQEHQREQLIPQPLIEHVQPLLQLCGDPRGRHSPTPFAEWSESMGAHFTVRKIAEASYGEVYRLSLKAEKTGFSKADESILKFIALKPPENLEKPNGKSSRKRADDTSWMSAVSGVQSEVRLLRRMVPVPGFTNFREIRVLVGRPSRPFITAWKEFKASQPKDYESAFPDPSRKTSFSEHQLWAVIEMQDAGTDLERAIVKDIWSVWDVFWGVTLAIGKGETGMRFEHRDLHLGNICIRSNRSGEEATKPTIRNVKRKLGYTALETTVIDYTLSRADMEDSDDGNDEDVAYYDCDRDQEIFTGDADEDYQYDIYRFMRASMLHSDPLVSVQKKASKKLCSSPDWKKYNPQTNLIWLHYVLHKLLGQVTWPSEDEAATLERLHGSENVDFARKRALQLERRLRRLDRMLEMKNLPKCGLTSAGDLIGYAVAEDWLTQTDVSG